DASFLSGRTNGTRGLDRTEVILDSSERVYCQRTDASGRVAVSVRPENIRLLDPATSLPPGENAVRATVETLEYAGGDTYVVLRKTNGEAVVARRPSVEVWNRPETQPGAAVLATFAPGCAVVVAEDHAESDAEMMP